MNNGTETAYRGGKVMQAAKSGMAHPKTTSPNCGPVHCGNRMTLGVLRLISASITFIDLISHSYVEYFQAECKKKSSYSFYAMFRWRSS
jgi:hypothetical protein